MIRSSSVAQFLLPVCLLFVLCQAVPTLVHAAASDVPRRPVPGAETPVPPPVPPTDTPPVPTPTPTPTPEPTPGPTPTPGPAPSPSPSPGPTITEPTREGLTNPFGEKTLPQLIGSIIRLMIGIVGALFLALLIWGGLEWMTAMGDPSAVKSAKATITNAVIGLSVIVLSYSAVTVLLTVASQFVTAR